MVAALCGFPARPRLRPHAGPAPRRRYERRRPEKTTLHKIISENLACWLEWRDEAEPPVPGYVEEELRGYLECGILCFSLRPCPLHGLRPGVCHRVLVQRRGVCPSCNGRHRAQTAADLVDHVIPPVPVRQWVISVPKRLRGFLADRPAAVTALTRIFIEEIERLLGAAAGVTSDASAPAAARPRLGAVSFLHRFGSALNHHVHLHVCATEGAFVPAADGAGCDASPAFLPPRPITPADLAAVAERVRRRVIRWFRLTRLLDTAAAADMLTWENSSFSVDASVRITINRPRRAELFSELGAPAAVLKHRHRYHGVFAPNHKPRSHDTSRIAWAKLMARVGEEFPLACPTCGGDIRLREDGRQEPAHFEPEVRKRAKARMASPA